jgi:GPH family glycoside/pentoside/hexuronide:cation symporter
MSDGVSNNNTTEIEPLSFMEKLGYGFGDGASNFFFGLSAAAVGTMLIVTKVVDAVSDPVMGLIADRTRSRWGKFRPYLLWGAIPYAVCGYAMFANPDLSDTGKLIYAYVTYTLMMLAYTAINVPYSALMGVISPSSIERTKVSSYRFICAFAAAWLIGTFVTPLKNILGGGDEALGFQLTMAIFAVLSVALFWISFATTRERVSPPQVESNVRLDLKALIGNGPWFVLFVAAIFTLMSIAVRGGTMLYYFKYYVGDDGTALFLIFDKTAIFLSLGVLTTIVGVAMAKTLSEHFEKRNLLIVLTLVNAASMSVFYFIPPDQYWLMLAVNCLGSLVIGPTPALVWAMYADCADYGEWQTGRRITGLTFSTLQFAQKLGLAFGAGLAGIILSLFGFVANVQQSASSLEGIRFMFSVLPALLSAAGAAAIVFYGLNKSKVQEIEQHLAERNSLTA